MSKLGLNISAVWKRSLIVSSVLISPAVFSVDVCLFLYTFSCDYIPVASVVNSALVAPA